MKSSIISSVLFSGAFAFALPQAATSISSSTTVAGISMTSAPSATGTGFYLPSGFSYDDPVSTYSEKEPYVYATSTVDALPAFPTFNVSRRFELRLWGLEEKGAMSRYLDGADSPVGLINQETFQGMTNNTKSVTTSITDRNWNSSLIMKQDTMYPKMSWLWSLDTDAASSFDSKYENTTIWDEFYLKQDGDITLDNGETPHPIFLGAANKFEDWYVCMVDNEVDNQQLLFGELPAQYQTSGTCTGPLKLSVAFLDCNDPDITVMNMSVTGCEYSLKIPQLADIDTSDDNEGN